MAHLLRVLAELALVGTVSCLLAWWLESRRQSSKRVVPALGAPLRLVCAGKIARCRLESMDGPIWRLSPPVSTSEAFAAVTGAPVLGEIAVTNGVAVFRAHSEGLDRESGGVLISRPNHLMYRDRRKERRAVGGSVLFEGAHSELIDLSGVGARVKTGHVPKRGERVRLDLTCYPDPVFAWVLEATEGVVRVRFEERLKLPALK